MGNTGLFLCYGALLGLGVGADPAPVKDPLAGAAARIEQHRQADAAITVVDVAGRPVPSARVTVAQTRHEFLFGCNLFNWGRLDTPEREAAYRDRFKALFNFATLGFYWPSYEPVQGRPQHERTEQVARWCREQGITVKGHPLAWNFMDPAWLPQAPDEIRRLQMARIDDCVSRFPDLIPIWDVVNEATHFERDEFRKRAPKMTAMWEKAGRVEFVLEALRHARQANPRATLLVNDYRTDQAYADLLTRLAAVSPRPFDVIGIQSHMHGGAWSAGRTWEVCERFARFGVPLHFTETTVVSGKKGWEMARKGVTWPSTPEGEAAQAEAVEQFYTVLFSHPAVEAITWWDFSDYRAWQRAPAGLVRQDQTPKPAYERLLALVKGRWWTRTTVQTDARGQASFRGFRGDYQVTVEAGEGRQAVARLTLGKKGPNRVTVKVP